MKQFICWTIAGSDCSGAAGIQTDLRTFQNLGTHGCSIVTAVTSQNTDETYAIDYPSSNNIASQLNALQYDLSANAIKIGMLGQLSTIDVVYHFLKNAGKKIVLDPVMYATSGKKLFSGDIAEYLNALKKLFPLVDLITPNLHEAEILSDIELHSSQDIEKITKKILSFGAKSVLIKGGHQANDQFSQDYWSNGTESLWLSCKRQANSSHRGTGCTLSSAITACLAQGYDLKDALVIGKMYVNQGIRLANQSILLTHAGWPEHQADLPFLSHHRMNKLPQVFTDCGTNPLGLYPVVDSAAWLKILLPLGIKTIQLRIKNKQNQELENEIIQSITLAKKFNARLFINDYWELAIRHGAYGVHLGQEDLNTADIGKIQQMGLRLGISTHCYYEVARAHTFNPSYLACGPIYATTSKMMHFAPQGIANLARWRRTLNYPLVAIGGINLQRLPEILSTNISGIAMISEITKAADPVAVTEKLLTLLNQFKSC